MHHPLDPLTPAEIGLTAKLVKEANPPNTVHFKHITLIEPSKKVLRPYLAAERANERRHAALTRRATALYYHRGTADLFVATVDLGSAKVEQLEKLDPRYLGHADMDEVVEVRDKCMSHPKVLERIRQYGLPDNFAVVCDTWPYGRDRGGLNDRRAQVWIVPLGLS